MLPAVFAGNRRTGRFIYTGSGKDCGWSRVISYAVYSFACLLGVLGLVGTVFGTSQFFADPAVNKTVKITGITCLAIGILLILTAVAIYLIRICRVPNVPDPAKKAKPEFVSRPVRMEDIRAQEPLTDPTNENTEDTIQCDVTSHRPKPKTLPLIVFSDSNGSTRTPVIDFLTPDTPNPKRDVGETASTPLPQITVTGTKQSATGSFTAEI